MGSINSIREQINIFLYYSKNKVLLAARIINLLISTIAIGAIIYFYGFPQTQVSRSLLLNIIQGSFVFYIANYVLHILYHWKPKRFFSENKLETLFILLLFFEGLSFQITGKLIGASIFSKFGVEQTRNTIDGFIQLYLLLLIVLGLSKTSSNIPKIKFEPSTLFVAGFLIISSAGSLLLCLPEMQANSKAISVIDATFTSVSASCVTGLSVIDIGTDLSVKGQLVVLLLMKLGALNIVSYGSMFAFFSKFGIGVKQHEIMEDIVNKYNSISPSGMIQKFIIWSTSIELLGSIFIYFSIPPQKVDSNSIIEHYFFSIFHSVSAFTNGGFSLLNSGLYNEVVRFNYTFQWIIIGLMFLGALGLLTMFDIINISKIKRYGLNLKAEPLGQ